MSNQQERLVNDLVASAQQLLFDGASVGDLKLAAGALQEMRAAFKMFAPYHKVRKVSTFGSARTREGDPVFKLAETFARQMAERSYMVITGAGPGVMEACQRGAGRAMSFGINIRLPFEQGVSTFIAADPKLIEMKYFFTRKLALMKESSGFVVLPGGFGTLDELLELLTLLQTGKAEPAPIVCLDVPHGHFWRGWEQFLEREVAPLGLISAGDDTLLHVTDDVDEAVAQIRGFYRNFHSIRYVGDLLVIRLRAAPTEAELEELSVRFADVCVEPGIEASPALPVEVADDDVPGLPRIVLQFDRASYARLRMLIDALNELGSAPPDLPSPPAPRPVAPTDPPLA